MVEKATTMVEKATKSVLLSCIGGQWIARFVESPDPITQIDMNRFDKVLLRGHRLYVATKRLERAKK